MASPRTLVSRIASAGLSTPAIARPPSSPGKNACTPAASRSATRPSAYGRPATSTATTGLPVSMRATRRSSCTPGSVRSVTSQPSPEVP